MLFPGAGGVFTGLALVPTYSRDSKRVRRGVPAPQTLPRGAQPVGRAGGRRGSPGRNAAAVHATQSAVRESDFPCRC